MTPRHSRRHDMAWPGLLVLMGAYKVIKTPADSWEIKPQESRSLPLFSAPPSRTMYQRAFGLHYLAKWAVKLSIAVLGSLMALLVGWFPGLLFSLAYGGCSLPTSQLTSKRIHQLPPTMRHSHLGCFLTAPPPQIYPTLVVNNLHPLPGKNQGHLILQGTRLCGSYPVHFIILILMLNRHPIKAKRLNYKNQVVILSKPVSGTKPTCLQRVSGRFIWQRCIDCD